MLVTVAVIGLSTVARHTPAQNQTWLTLKNIRTDSATALYVDNHTDRGSWFREMLLPTGDSKLMTENLQSVAATL